MHFKKIVKAVIIFVVVELSLSYLFQWYLSGQLLQMVFGSDVLNDQAVQTAMASLREYCDSQLCIETAFFMSVTYLIFSFRAPAYSPQQEKRLLRRKLYNQLDEKSKRFVNQLNGEEKERFYREYQEQLWVKFHIDVSQYLSDIRKPRFSRLTGMMRKIAGWSLAAFIALHAFHVYALNVPVIESARMYVATETTTNGNDGTAAAPEIEVVTNNDAGYAGDISEIKEAISNMPSFLLTRCQKIYIMDETHYLRSGAELGMEDLRDSAAFSYSGDMSIRIRIVDHSIVANTYSHTIAHELSHIFDFSMGDPYVDSSGCSNTKEFLALYRADPESLSAYGATSQYEFFAEGGAMYILEPDTLSAQNDDVYRYFDKLYGPYMN